MADKIPEVLADLPEDWGYEQIVAPEGESVGLTPQHGYNYLMKKVNECARTLNQIVEAMGQPVQGDVVTVKGGAYITLVGDFGDPPYEIKITEDGMSVISSYKVSLSVDPSGGGTVRGAGTYKKGDSVTVHAEASSGYTFSGWKRNGAAVSAKASYTFTVTADTSLTAVFEKEAAVTPLGDWIETTLPHKYSGNSVTYGGGTFVVVAMESGSNPTEKAAYSTDGGKTWTASTLPSAEYWNSVTYGNGTFVAVAGSNSSKAAYSTDGGKMWTASALPSSASWNSVTYGDGTFVAVAGNNNKAAYSTDGGKTWTASALPSSASWNSIAYGNGTFVVVAGNKSNKAAYSTDGGKTWTSATLPFVEYWTSVAYGNGVFVTVCPYADDIKKSVVYSTDSGKTWTASTLPITIDAHGVVYGNSKFVAVEISGSRAAYSIDEGKTWTVSALPSVNMWRDVAYGNGNFVAVASGVAAYASG